MIKTHGISCFKLCNLFSAISWTVFSFSMAGPPKLCMANDANGSHLTYTVCGFPVPKITWGFMESGINNFINATKRNDLYYAHDYSLSLTPDMYEKRLHLEAVGCKSITISWSKKVKKDCKSHFYWLFIYKYLLFVFYFSCIVLGRVIDNNCKLKSHKKLCKKSYLKNWGLRKDLNDSD